jgi:heptosyltransferase II
MLKRIVIKFGNFYSKNSSKPSFIKIEKIAILKSGAIGDILMTTPMVRALKKKYPEAKITYITAEKFRSVLEGNKFIDKIITFDAGKLFGSNVVSRLLYFREFAKTLRSENFDVCFVLDKSYLAGQFAKSCKIPVRIGFDRFGEGFANTHNAEYKIVRHEIDYYLELLKFANVTENGKRMDLFINKKDELFASGFLKKNKISKSDVIIGVAPAATKDPKNEHSSRAWPSENYKKLAERVLKSYNAKIIFFGNKDDKVVVDDIMSKVGSKTFSCAGKTTLKQAAALIKLCDVFVSHDSGLIHVASAMNVPVVSIFGPTDPRRKAPLNDKSVYLWKDKGYCELCEVFGKFPYCDNHSKTDSVDVEDVLRTVDSIINV